MTTPQDPNALLTNPTIGGAIIMLLGAIGVASWSYIKARLLPEAKTKVEATLVGGVIGGNDVRLVVEALGRLEKIGQQTTEAVDDCKRATEDVERAVRGHAASAVCVALTRRTP